MLVAIVVGVGGVFALFWAMDRVVNWLPERLPRGRAAVRASSGPRVVILVDLPRLSGVQHAPHQLQGRATGRAGSGSTTTGSCSPTRACCGRSATRRAGSIVVPLVAVSVGLLFADARGSAHARRVAREVVDLPADGDLVRRRCSDLPSDLQLPTRGVRDEHRVAQRHQVRARPGTGRVVVANRRGTTCSSW